ARTMPALSEGEEIARTQPHGVARNGETGCRLEPRRAWHAHLERTQHVTHETAAVEAMLGRLPTAHVPRAHLRPGERNERVAKRLGRRTECRERLARLNHALRSLSDRRCRHARHQHASGQDAYERAAKTARTGHGHLSWFGRSRRMD